MRLGYCHSGDPLEVIQSFVRAEKAGFDSAWMGDHFAFWVPNTVYPETFSILGATALVTNNIKLGTAVTDPFRRSSTLLAQSGATLDNISNGRGILGIGGGEPMNIVPYGIDYSKPISRLKESVLAIRQIWKATYSDPVTFSGKFEKLDNAFIQISPVHNRSMPIYIAGTSAKALKLAGEFGDGWLAHVHSPKTFQEDLHFVSEGASLAGKTLEDIDTVAWLLCSIDRNEDRARERIVLPAGMELVLAHDKLGRLGCEEDISDKLALKRLMVNKKGIDSLQTMAKKVSLSAIELCTAFGTPDQCISKFEKFRKAGAKHVIVALIGENVADAFDLFQRYVIPHVHSI